MMIVTVETSVMPNVPTMESARMESASVIKIKVITVKFLNFWMPENFA